MSMIFENKPGPRTIYDRDVTHNQVFLEVSNLAPAMSGQLRRFWCLIEFQIELFSVFVPIDGNLDQLTMAITLRSVVR